MSGCHNGEQFSEFVVNVANKQHHLQISKSVDEIVSIQVEQ